jgi:hypothetical protein
MHASSELERVLKHTDGAAKHRVRKPESLNHRSTPLCPVRIHFWEQLTLAMEQPCPSPRPSKPPRLQQADPPLINSPSAGGHTFGAGLRRRDASRAVAHPARVTRLFRRNHHITAARFYVCAPMASTEEARLVGSVLREHDGASVVAIGVPGPLGWHFFFFLLPDRPLPALGRPPYRPGRPPTWVSLPRAGEPACATGLLDLFHRLTFGAGQSQRVGCSSLVRPDSTTASATMLPRRRCRRRAAVAGRVFSASAGEGLDMSLWGDC